MDPSNVVRRPLVTEKSTSLAEHRQYVFRVHPSASKHAIVHAIATMFHVEVEAVNVMNVRGKSRRFGRYSGPRPDWRKAIVTLRTGHKIDIVPGT